MNANTQWQIFIGTNDGDTGLPLAEARINKTVIKICNGLSEAFGGCTVQQAVGAWGAVREDSVVITALPNDEAEAHINAAAAFALNRLNQQSVLITKSAIEAALLSR